MKMYLVLSQVEHQTIECHRKNITIVYLFGLSVVSLSYCYKPGRPPLPASLACPGRPPLADLPWPPIPPRQLSPGRPPLALLGRPPLTDLPCRPPLAQTSPNTPLADIPCLADLPSASHTSLAGLEKTKNDECLEFFSFFIIFYRFSSFFDSLLFIFLSFLGEKNR